MAKTKLFRVFLWYLVLFHLCWLFWVLLLYPRVRRLGEATLSYALVNMCIRLVVWVLPVFLYLRYVDRTSPLAYLKLKRHWGRGVLFGFAFTGINLLLLVARFGIPHTSVHVITWNSILSTSLLIGFVEEVPYRGFIFQKLQERFSFWTASLISSFLFLIIHLPGWTSLHLFRLDTAIFVFLFGALMTIILKYSKSLWGPIVSHSLNDFLSAVVFRS